MLRKVIDSLLIPLMLAALMTACKAGVRIGTQDVDAVAPEQGAAKGLLDLSMLPQAPETAPDPWTPYAVEKSMGAEWCPETPDDDRGLGGGLLNRPCLGPLPRHLAEVLVGIPAEDIFLSAEVRASQALKPQPYLALPGFGTRPDFMTDVDILEGIVVRSFEGIDPADTVYLVVGPFRCIDDDPLAAREGQYVLQTEECQSAHADTRLYKWTKAGVLRDVTRDYLPPPELSPDEQALTGPFRPQLDIAKLGYAPVMRWTTLLRDRTHPDLEYVHDYDPIPMPDWVPDAKRLGDNRLHSGFVVWNGKNFEVRQRVSRSLWPIPYCDSLRPDRRCRVYGKTPDRYDDKFVDGENAYPSERNTR